jgi:hypothetical protein
LDPCIASEKTGNAISGFLAFTLMANMILATFLFILLSIQDVLSSNNNEHEYTQSVFVDPSAQQKRQTWFEKYGPQDDLVFTGPLAFSHVEYARCLDEAKEGSSLKSPIFDIAVLGMPFDTSVRDNSNVFIKKLMYLCFGLSPLLDFSF